MYFLVFIGGLLLGSFIGIVCVALTSANDDDVEMMP